MKDFVNFIREQGMVGVAIGFIVGGAVSQLVEAIVQGIVNPLIAAMFDISSLSEKSTVVGDSLIQWGAVVAIAINFLILMLVAYALIRVFMIATAKSTASSATKSSKSTTKTPAKKAAAPKKK